VYCVFDVGDLTLKRFSFKPVTLKPVVTPIRSYLHPTMYTWNTNINSNPRPHYLRGVVTSLELCLRLVEASEVLATAKSRSSPAQLAYFLDIVYQALICPYGSELKPARTEEIKHLAGFLERTAKEGIYTRVLVEHKDGVRSLSLPEGVSLAWPDMFAELIAAGVGPHETAGMNYSRQILMLRVHHEQHCASRCDQERVPREDATARRRRISK
jgi:hypothetical protein